MNGMSSNIMIVQYSGFACGTSSKHIDIAIGAMHARRFVRDAPKSRLPPLTGLLQAKRSNAQSRRFRLNARAPRFAHGCALELDALQPPASPSRPPSHCLGSP